ncbi:hypothetical protein QYM36_005443 [Artemia franciscana]|uniref:Mitochondrial cardiolipin hydrolase n=2 Tax=Artemia franciscana TaxID=6661 RepID=A0AA88LAD8_ARTSF|nr:hypothetical protein QYM36_005443 [Artemia franciscana]
MWKESLAIFGGVCLTKFVYDYIFAKKAIPSKIVKEVLFFPDKGIACPNVSCEDKNCRYSHESTCLRALVNHLKSAKKSLDVCVCVFSCHELAETLVYVSKGGVPVRVLSDKSIGDVVNSRIPDLRAKGIPVRIHNTPYLMHHKFAIVDNELLLCGSFNWTRQAVTGNNESVIVTNDKDFVERFCNEFSRLWELNSPQNL